VLDELFESVFLLVNPPFPTPSVAALADPILAKIERLHQLLESEDSVVTWDDRIPDPDNPTQPRQIDVTIRRGGRLTLVECRIHKGRQGVKWIEELHGRRQSLRADSVIAVSASGFTKGAIRKSERFGIILRSLYTLSEGEIRNWGKEIKAVVVYYEFCDSIVTFRLPYRDVRPEITFRNEDGSPVVWRGLFELVMSMPKLSDNPALDKNPMEMDVEVFSPILVCGAKPSSVLFSSRVRRVRQEISLTAVVAYAAPLESSPDRYAYIGKYDLDLFEILQNTDQVGMVVDTSQLVPPPNCLLREINMDFGREVEMRWMKPIGLHNILLHRASLQFRYVFS
jgi:Restriction endonuclease